LMNRGRLISYNRANPTIRILYTLASWSRLRRTPSASAPRATCCPPTRRSETCLYSAS
jgi:hypothetical protein